MPTSRGSSEYTTRPDGVQSFTRTSELFSTRWWTRVSMRFAPVAPSSSIQCNNATCTSGWYGGAVSVALSAIPGELGGAESHQRLFGHMFKVLEAPRFHILNAVAQGDEVFLTWDFDFQTRGRGAVAMRIHGASHLRFDAAGQVELHRDYWDAAEELYEKLPVLGAMMRWLKRRAAG